MYVVKLPLLAEHQQKVGELVLSMISPWIIILENTLNEYKNVATVILTVGIMFPFFT
jgi:hypothetical protein